MAFFKNILRKYRDTMNKPVMEKLEKIEKNIHKFENKVETELEVLNKNLLFLINQTVDITKVKTPASLVHVQTEQLDVLRRYDAFLKAINVEYFLIYGTLLGIIRTKSFVPWDDDVDTGMFHEDFYKILENEKLLKEYGLGLSSPFTKENNFIRPGWHKIFNLKKPSFHIDIFLFDIVSSKDNKKILETKSKYYYLAEKERKKYLNGAFKIETLSEQLTQLNKMYYSELNFTTKDKANKDDYIIPTFTNFNSQNLTKFGYIFPIQKAAFSVLSDTEPILTVPIPNQSEDMLIDFFGKDYMSFPNKLYPLHPFHFEEEK